MDRVPLIQRAESAAEPLAREPLGKPRLRMPSVADIRAERMKRTFKLFVQAAWHIVEPATPLVWNWHMDAVCDHVQALVTGKLGKNNIVINVPPGTSKSTIVSVCLLPWIWTFRPSYRAIFASGNPRVSSRDSVKRRMIMESDWYRKTFDIAWHFRRDQNEKLSYTNTATGVCLATTTNAKVTGERYHGLFVDDAIDATEAFQQVEVDKANTWWDQAFHNRVSDERTGTRCIIGQRLREDDLPGYVLQRDGLDYWEWLSIPQEWGEPEEEARRITGLNWTDPRRYPLKTWEPGETRPPTVLLFPARFSRESLVIARLVLGQAGYEGQHQQRPSMLQGEIFARGHAQFIMPGMIPVATIVQRLLSLDAAIKIKEENDYSVLLEAWEFDRGILLRSCLREKLRYTQLKEAVSLKAAAINPSVLLIEDKASGSQLLDEFQQNSGIAVKGIVPNIDKAARARPLTPYWEANRVFFPCDENGVPEPWVQDFLAELYSFPKAPKDDQVDAFTQLLQYLFLAPGARGLIEFYNAEQARLAAERKAQQEMDAKHHPVQHVVTN